MSAFATKCKVAAAATAVAAGAFIAPVAANAAPVVSVPTSPVNRIVGDFALQPTVTSPFVVQFTGIVTRTSTFWTRFTILNYQSKLEANPTSPRAARWQARIDQLNAQLARYGEVEMTSCRNGRSTSIVAGSYGGVTTGTCVSA